MNQSPDLEDKMNTKHPLLSDMDRAVLCMPMSLAFAGDIAQAQYYSRVQALVQRVDAAAHQSAPEGYRLVRDGALQMVRNALRTDAENGKVVRGEMLQELDTATFCFSPRAAIQAPEGADNTAAMRQALEALEEQHRDRRHYSISKQRANATCGEFRESPLSSLIESGYMHGMGKRTEAAIEALRAALAAQPQAAPVAQWRPIETAPRDGTNVLLHEQYEDVPFVGYWWGNREWRADRTFYDTDGDACVIDKVSQRFVTHWMPLPAAPQTKEQQ